MDALLTLVLLNLIAQLLLISITRFSRIQIFRRANSAFESRAWAARKPAYRAGTPLAFSSLPPLGGELSMRKKKAGWNAYAFYVIMWGMAPAYMYAAEKIYKTTDEYGATLYTNTPPGPGAQAIDVPELSVIPPRELDDSALEDPMRPQLQLAEDTTRQEENIPVGNNYNLDIVNPRQNETVPITGSIVQLVLSLDPPLDVDAGHRIEVVVDGAVSYVTRDTRVSLPGLDRGSHQLTAQVVNDEGDVLQSTQTVTFYAQQPTVYSRAGR
jgi:hypothetical protein